MDKITIIRDDNAVIVNGDRQTVDCSSLPANIHAIQWDGTSGHVEHAHVKCVACGHTHKEPNQVVIDMTPYGQLLAAWKVEAVKADEARAKVSREAAEAKAAAEDAVKAATEALKPAAPDAA